MIRQRTLLIAALAASGCAEIDPRFYLGEVCDAVDPDEIFCTDFEEPTLEQWDDYDENPDEMNVVVPDPGPRGLEGNHVMRLRPPPGPSGVDLVKVLPGYYDALYVRWYARWEEGYDLGGRTALWPGVHAGSRDTLGVSDSRPAGNDRFTVLLSHDSVTHQLVTKLDYRGMYQDCTDPAEECYRDVLPCLGGALDPRCSKPQHRVAASATPIEKGRWYCIELFVDAGTPVAEDAQADGRLGLWLDEVLVAEYSDLWFRTDPNLKLAVLWLLEYDGDEHGDEGVLYDEVVVSRTPIGCD